jgi:uncharacterized protein DUF5991
MNRKGLSLVIYSVVIILVAGCSQTTGKELDTWLGEYDFSEKPIKAIAGYNMMMEWNLTVNKIEDKYNTILNVNGQQTSFSLFNTIAGNDSVLYIIYDYKIEGMQEAFKKGDTLFSLQKAGAYLKTRWAAIQPILTENPPVECRCFIFRGRNKDNNTLTLPK